jgi:transposase
MSRTYLGIDYHKKFSFVTAVNESGQELFKGKVLNTVADLQKLLSGLPKPVKAVVETSRTHWVMVDLLKSLEIEVIVANALKLRAIATAQIKTDKRDSDILAHLLRTDLIPQIHITSEAVRLKRAILRDRMELVKQKSRTKCRIHQLVDRNRVTPPAYSDLFGAAGRVYLESVKIEPSEDFLLKNLLKQLDFFDGQMKLLEKRLRSELKDDARIDRLKSIPGIGEVLASTIFLEIDTISRFKDPSHFIAYTGLCPSLYASGNFAARGRLLWACNKTLRWAFVEAAWGAIRASEYCRSYFQKISDQANKMSAIIALARRLAHIAYKILKEERFYEERTFPSRSQSHLALCK